MQPYDDAHRSRCHKESRQLVLSLHYPHTVGIPVTVGLDQACILFYCIIISITAMLKSHHGLAGPVPRLPRTCPCSSSKRSPTAARSASKPPVETQDTLKTTKTSSSTDSDDEEWGAHVPVASAASSSGAMSSQPQTQTQGKPLLPDACSICNSTVTCVLPCYDGFRRVHRMAR